MSKKRRMIAVLMDRSWSMASVAPEVEQGIAQFLDSQREAEEKLKSEGTASTTKVLLAEFGSTYEVAYGPVKLDDAPEYRMECKGNTALYDSIFRIVDATEVAEADAENKGKPLDDVTVVVMTDGGENASHDHRDPHKVKDLLERVQAKGWTVLFLAANQDAVLTGRSLGFEGDRSITYNAATSSGSVLRSVGAAMSQSYASGVPVSFSKDDREAVQ